MQTLRALKYIDSVVSMNVDDNDILTLPGEAIHISPVSTVRDSCFPDLMQFRSDNPKKLIIGSLNINSLRNKFQPLRDILCKGYVDIMSICESKLDESFPHSQFSVKSFHCFRQDSTSRSGGIMVYLRGDLPCTRRDDLSINDENIQSLVIEIRIRKEKWFIVSLYRLPNANAPSFCLRLSKMFEKIIKESNMCIAMGDVNIDMLRRNSSGHIALTEVLDVFNLVNVVSEPTCFKGTPSLIDVILTSNSRRLGKVINFNCGLSDYHNFVVTCSKIEVLKPKSGPVTYRSYKHFNEDAFKDDIGRLPLSILETFDDVSDRQWAYNQLVMPVVDQHAPLKTRYITNRCAHMNSQLRKAIYEKRVARNRHLKNKGNNHLWEAYRRARNKYVKLNRLSMQNYFKKACDGGPQTKSFWDTIKPYFTDKGTPRSAIMLRENGDIITDDKSVACIFNDYFYEITLQTGDGDNVNELSIDEIQRKYASHSSIQTIRECCEPDNSFRFTHVTVDEVLKMLSKLDPKKSTGYDGLPAKLIRVASDVMAPEITHLVNIMIDQCCFPDTMKCAEISPVFKKEDALSKNKYRPVSILTSVSKVFEKVINQQLVDHFYARYAGDLSAYRMNHNTQSVLLKAVNDWKLALDRGKYVGALLMDLSKAFDVIPHGLLLAKMKAYGYGTDAVMLIRSYLSSRRQRVKIGNARSEWVTTDMGVPQGSILGPTLFNVFLNDLFLLMNETEATIYNYADDNTLSYTSDSVNDLIACLNHHGSTMTAWFEINGMKANPDKYQTIMFGKRKESLGGNSNLSISGVTITTDSSVKLLGICIDEKLTFSDHAASVCRKAGRQVNALMRLSNVLDTETKLKVYSSFIHSAFMYCPAVWLICDKTHLNQLERMNCRALRFVYNDYDSTYDALLLKGNHKSIRVLLLHAMAIEVYKCINGISPAYMSSMFQRDQHKYNVRSRYGLIQPNFRSIRYGYNTFGYLGAKIWNNLPNSIKESASISIFKRRISNFNDVNCLERLL